MKVRGMREKGNKKRRGCFQLRRLIVSSIAVFPVSRKHRLWFRLQALPSAARHGVSTAISACTKIPRHKIAGIAKACKSCAENCVHRENLLFRGSPDGSRFEIFFIIPFFFWFVNRKFQKANMCAALLPARRGSAAPLLPGTPVPEWHNPKRRGRSAGAPRAATESRRRDRAFAAAGGRCPL